MTKLLRMLPFLVVMVAVLYLGNLVVFRALVLAFNIQDLAKLQTVALSLGIFSSSFIISTILGNTFYNFFTRVYYYLASVWIGFFTYAFIVSLVYGLLTTFSTSFIPVGPFLFEIAALVSIYGVLHARTIVTTRVTVSLPNLPSSWHGRKAVWISDIHLGPLYNSNFSKRIADQIMALAPDIIFVGGDLYDGTNAPSIQDHTAPLQKLTAPFGVHFITGNHEEYGDLAQFLSVVQSVGMKVLKDEVVECDGLQIVGLDYHTTSKRDSFKKVMDSLALDRAKPSILLKHVPLDLDVAEEAGISLTISGHTHNAQMWPLTYIAQSVHKGYAYGLKRLKNMQVFTSSGTGTWGPPMRVGTDCEIVLLSFE